MWCKMLIVRAERVPTKREPRSPGVWVTAMASICNQSFGFKPASMKAWWMTGWMASRWERAAISGITPP